MYSSLTAAHFDGAPMHKFDWLGQSLAIITGVADGARAKRILASYPHGPMGAPVIWPQQIGMPVYHNRAMWPFVTGYGLRAAIAGRNVSVADAAYDSLMRGAALNVSNMENLEWLSGQPLLLDEQHPDLIGPVINSRRQLWSVGAYLGMVVRDVFGVSTTATGIELKPFITAKLRGGVFKGTDVVQLANLRLQGRSLDVTLRLPPAAAAGAGGYYEVERILLNGKPARADIAWDQLQPQNRIEIVLGKLAAGEQAIRRVNADPYQETPAVFGPREPKITGLQRSGGANAVTIAGDGGATYNLYRDGKLVASKLAAGTWTDRAAPATACYAAEAQFAGSGNRSHHGQPRCVDAGVTIRARSARRIERKGGRAQRALRRNAPGRLGPAGRPLQREGGARGAGRRICGAGPLSQRRQPDQPGHQRWRKMAGARGCIGPGRGAGRDPAAARAHRQGRHAGRVFDAAGGAPEARRVLPHPHERLL
jgi:hypothetical protein